MHPSRRRYVQASRETESKHFVKIILPSIHANQMRIPEEFIRRFGDELSTDATITVPDGRVWKMKLKKYAEHVLFCKEWRNFVKYYSLSYGYQLVFRYEGNSKFHVLIFDITCAEICYPCKTWKTNRQPTLDKRKRSKVDADDLNLKSQSKPRNKGNGSCSSHGKQVKSECSVSRSYLERANDAAANRFKPKYPSVTSTIKRHRLYVASKFGGKYLKPNVAVMLQNCNGEQWEVSCIRHNERNSAMMITRGWSKFVWENDLSEGDPCVLELIKRNHPVVLKLTVLSPL